jgi:hypothetical protein
MDKFKSRIPEPQTNYHRSAPLLLLRNNPIPIELKLPWLGLGGRHQSGRMDPEQTFLWVHARLSGMLSQLLTPWIRLVLEYLYLAGAVTLFCLLIVMHTNFVQQVWIPCLVLFYCPRLLSLLLLLLWFCDCLRGRYVCRVLGTEF